MTSTIYENIPVVPLRGLVVLPGELLHFDAGREKSVSALQSAVKKDGMVFLSSQLDSRKNVVSHSDIYPIGTVCNVRQLVSLPGESVRVLVEGITRARIVECSVNDEYMAADVEYLESIPCTPVDAEALRRRLADAFSEYVQLGVKFGRDAIANIERRRNAGEYTDLLANLTITKTEERQQVLELTDIYERMTCVLGLLLREIDIKRADKRIAQEVKKQVDKAQREYYLQEQIKAIRKELGNTEKSEADDFRSRLEEKRCSEEIRALIAKEIDRLEELPASSHEMPASRGYIECLLDLPFEEKSEDTLSVKEVRRVLDEDHYGLEKVKKRILEYIAVSKLTGKLNGQIICFVGPPGVGKTSISESIARAIGRNFVRMSLGGVRDEAEIRGHRRTYIGAMPGRIIAAMRQAKTVNPVILFDEIDKLASDYRGDPAAAMLEVLDSAQNTTFRDHYLEVPYDLSKVMFITTANTRDTIPRPLLDRMEIIEVPSYLETEKLEIAKRHLLPKQLEKHGLTKSMLSISEAILTDIVRGYTAEAGVRELERTLAAVCRKAACEVAEDKQRVRMSKQRLHAYLGQPKYLSAFAEKEDAVGMANGLAWTSVGGETLEIEVQTVKGSGQVIITGQLGDVMQESARTALTFVRANAEALGIDATFLQNYDIHVHVPEGAVPKDGPSAGITIMTAIASALTNIPVRAGVAMTGEITLRGRVLRIGGLREKLLAAVRAGMHTVVIPAENKRDIEAEDMPAEVKKSLNIVYADHATTVLRTALAHMPEVNTSLNLVALHANKGTCERAVQ